MNSVICDHARASFIHLNNRNIFSFPEIVSAVEVESRQSITSYTDTENPYHINDRDENSLMNLIGK